MLYRRSLTREMGLTTGAVLTVLVAISLVVLFIRLLGDVARGELANEAVFVFLGFSLLYFLPVLMTIALFAGVLLPLSRMWRDSEMVIWFNAGLSLMQWMRPVLTFAVPFSLVILLLTLVLNPWVQTKRSEYSQELKSRSESALVAPGLFAESGAGQRVFYVESLNPLTGIVRNVFMRSMIDGQLGLVAAREGDHTQLPDGSRYLVFKDGRRYEGTPGQLDYRIVQFERYWMRLDPVAAERQVNIRQMSLAELLTDTTPPARAELLWRVGVPISALILAVMAIPLSFVNTRARRSYGLVVALLLYFVYNNLLSLSQAWVAQDKLNPWIGMGASHLLMLSAVVILFYRRSRQHSPRRRRP
ncbi:MAG TPA: LPS export ABC transporter permease LptF [Thiobacillus sp.]|nr:MAG: LPS export ABC transporter permease LptF [Hydrogenophilales bacterium 16-64-40]OZA34403.1 MAG: LPS export ABC transporter permease LptF [Hydrogenophilales bacterium 17-64-65]HQS81680.1 LPS export ABC transporter permease LptF [Thiobacillus sp.]HQT33113.1 LPS export ABC transporter permease LptF [Thiobacillus sp.]